MAESLMRDWPIPADAVQDGIRLSRADDLARWSVRTRDAKVLPGRMLSAAEYGDGHAFRLGPDEWFVVAPSGSMLPDIPEPCSIVDVSDRSIGIIIQGPDAAAVLQTGCPIDLDRGFSVGRATRTLFEQVEIVVWRRAEEHFHVEVWRSFADYLWRALGMAGRNTAGRSVPIGR